MKEDSSYRDKNVKPGIIHQSSMNEPKQKGILKNLEIQVYELFYDKE